MSIWARYFCRGFIFHLILTISLWDGCDCCPHYKNATAKAQRSQRSWLGSEGHYSEGKSLIREVSVPWPCAWYSFIVYICFVLSFLSIIPLPLAWKCIEMTGQQQHCWTNGKVRCPHLRTVCPRYLGNGMGWPQRFTFFAVSSLLPSSLTHQAYLLFARSFCERNEGCILGLTIDKI